MNVIIFDKYLFQLLKPNERKTIQVAYSNSPDVQKWKEHIIEIQESDYESTEDGIPKWLIIIRLRKFMNYKYFQHSLENFAI